MIMRVPARAPLVAAIVAFAVACAGAMAFQDGPYPSGPARVIDGDSLVIAGQPVRLSGIDAPEMGQDGGAAAKAAMIALVRRHPVTCTATGRDMYARIVATCGTAETPDLGQAMVRSGWAVRYPQYDPDCRYCAAEAEARGERSGLWAGEFQVPWDWRKEHGR